MFIDPKRIPVTGNPVIDASHARLAQLINLAYDQWRMGADRDTVADAMKAFVRGVEAHFTEEVELIRDAGYRDWEVHARVHEEFLTRLDELLADWTKGEPIDLDAFNLIDRLLYEHEFLDDQEFWTIFQGEKREIPAGEPLIEWSDDFRVGQDDIDRQHVALIKLINRLHLAIARKESKEEVLAELGDIMRHTKWHFAFEEELMRKHNIKGYDSHHILHENLLADLTEVLADFKGDRYDQLEDLLENYLKYWLLDHITHVDKGLGRQLAKATAQPS